jgi:hypothetical protein
MVTGLLPTPNVRSGWHSVGILYKKQIAPHFRLMLYVNPLQFIINCLGKMMMDFRTVAQILLAIQVTTTKGVLYGKFTTTTQISIANQIAAPFGLASFS